MIDEAVGAARVLHVVEDFDIALAPAVEAALRKLDGAQLVVVDLLQCEYVDSSAFALLARACKTYGDRFRVVAARDGRVDRVLRLMGFDQLTSIAASLDEAISQRGSAT